MNVRSALRPILVVTALTALAACQQNQDPAAQQAAIQQAAQQAAQQAVQDEAQKIAAQKAADQQAAQQAADQQKLLDAQKRAADAEKAAANARKAAAAAQQRANRAERRADDQVIAPQPVVVQHAPAQICNACGTIVSMKAIEQEGDASGAGAVLGAIAGGFAGNQIGGGHGREAATAIGAIAGGMGGHMAEKKIREQTAYKVTIKMDSGYTRTVTVSADMAGNFSVGNKVRVDDDGTLSLR